MFRRTLLLFLLATALGRAADQPVPELPVSTFFQSPRLASLVFSPNGKYIACLIPVERRMNLAVIDLEKGTKSLLTNFKDKQATAPTWANNDRILFRVDDEGKESFSLYAINRDGKDPAILAAGYDKAGTEQGVNVRFRSILRRMKNDASGILVLASLTHIDWQDVARMNLRDGKMTTVAQAPGAGARYIFDHDDQVRVAVYEKDRVRRVVYRDPKSKEWVTLHEHSVDAAGWEPMAFDGDNRTLFVSSNIGRPRAALLRYDVVTRQLGDVVIEDPVYDVYNEPIDYNPYALKGTIYNGVKKKIVGFAYRADKAKVVWFDDDYKELQRKIDASLPDTTNFILSASPDDSKRLIFSFSGNDPGVYYLFDTAKKKIEELGVTRPEIDPDKMALVEPVSFPARDGLTLHGYLTLPRGRAPKNLPLVLHPHGGPYGLRDDWRFSSEVQFYANRGYAVLQVNYRGSGGYGHGFEAAGFKKWGLEMQHDLTDGVKWLIDRGTVDADRVVISGASYGGYATMAGLAFTPELYCAGINYVGATDIDILIPKGVSAERLHWSKTHLGDLADAADRKRIYDTSPVNFADRIVAPVLMAYGKNDPRVVIEHGYDMERALKKAGKTYEMIIEAEEGHGFRFEERSIAFFTRVDEFLKKYVPPPGGRVKVGPTKVLEMTAPKTE